MVCQECGHSECQCVICICEENYGIDCPAHPVTNCDTCGLILLQIAISSGAQNWCKCFTSDSFTNSEPNRSISNGNATYSSSSDNFQDGKLPLETVSLDSSHPNIELGSTHAQSPDTETSESSMSDTSDCRTTGNDQDEQIDYLPVICSEENELVMQETVLADEEKLSLNPSHAQSLDTESSESSSYISGSLVTVKNLTDQMDYLQVISTEETGLVEEETIELIAEETPLNPSHAQSHIETSESSMPDISGCLTKGINRSEQSGNLPTNQPSEETKLDAEETELLNSLNILNDEQISHTPVNSADRIKYYMHILAQNIKNESLASSNSRSEKNTSITQASNSSSGRSVSGSPQVPFHGVVPERTSTPPFPGCSHDSTNQPFMCVPTVSVRQKFISPSTVTSGPSAKPPFYIDSATRRLQSHFSESAQNKSPTNPAFSKGSKNKLSIPITPASKYARSKGISPRESGNIIRPVGRTLDWLNKMTAAPGDWNPPEDHSSSPPPVELVKDVSELQNETKSDKDTSATKPQNIVIASDESSSTFACSETTAHQGLTCAEDTSPADSENKIVEQTKVSEESLDSCAVAISNLSTSPGKEFNNEETELKEQIQDSSKNSEDEHSVDT